jgi:hypothetical protein
MPYERSSASSIDAGGAPTLPSHDKRRLITEGAPMPALSPRLDASSLSERSSESSMHADATPTAPCPERRLITERAPMPALSPRLDAPSASERSSASSMDADAAPTLTCPDEQRLTTHRAPLPALSPRIDAPMPSERSSPFSMDANAAPTPPSPPSSKKRSLSPLLGMGDGHQDPNSSPCSSPSRRLRISAESTVVALAVAAAAAAAATLWSDVDGGHEDVQSLESAGIAVDLGRGDVQGLQPSGDGCHGVAPNYPKRWSDADEVTLLAAAAFFRERTGRSPLPIDAGALFDSIRDSVSPHINEANVSYKLTRFRSKFLHSAPGESATSHDRLLHDLSAKAWGSVNTVAREARDAATKTPVVTEVLEARDAATKMPVVTEVLREYWKMNELAGLSLEKGLSLLWKKNGRLIETRWRKQFDGEMKTQMRWHDLAKEICGLLNDTIKGLGT